MSNVCKLKKLKTVEYYWVDGYCGYLIANGNTRNEAINNAIEYINGEAEFSIIQGQLYKNKDELKYLNSLLND